MPIRKIRDPYNFSRCRWCNHYFLSHTSMADGIRICEWSNGGRISTKCKCKDFAPIDNLEFLEWQYKKKSERKK